MDKRHIFIWAVFVSLLLMAGCASKTTRGSEQDKAVAMELVDEAVQVLETSLEKDADGHLRQLLTDAKGVMVIPAMGDASLLVSFGGGNAVLLAKTDVGWTGPVFMSKGTVGYGLQAGVSKQRGLMVYMHEDDVRYLLSTGAVLQGDARLTFLTTNYQYNETPEFYESGDVFFVGERSGLYAGAGVDTGGFTDRVVLNEALTGVEGGGPRAILFEKKVQPEAARRLRELLTEAGIEGKAMEADASDTAKEKDGTEVPSN